MATDDKGKKKPDSSFGNTRIKLSFFDVLVYLNLRVIIEIVYLDKFK